MFDGFYEIIQNNWYILSYDTIQINKESGIDNGFSRKLSWAG